MAGYAENGGRRRGSRWRITAWAAAALLLVLPLLAMQVTDQVVWDVADFAVFGALLVGAGAIYELAVKKTGNGAYRSAVGVALAAALNLIWVSGAVGVIGNEGNDANLMYGGVLAIGILGAIIVRFQAQGMARALCATALAQALVAIIALIAGWGSAASIWPWDILMLTGFFTTLWLVSAGLFQNAAGAGSERGTV